MSSLRKPIAAALLTVLAAVRPAPAATPVEINEAVDRGKALLYALQKNGNWEQATTRKASNERENWGNPEGLQWGGSTAIATLALLSCGEDPTKNEHLKQAVQFLEHADIRGNYAIGIRAQVWNYLPPDDPDMKKARRRDRDLLVEAIHKNNQDPGWGFFSYGEGVPKFQYDHSISQFAVLGLWSLAQAGEDIGTDKWKQMDKAWRGHRQQSGAWYYLEPHAELQQGGNGSGIENESLSMTAAGVATLFITQDFAGKPVACSGNVKDADIDAGMQWIGGHYDDVNNGNQWSKVWKYYSMFGIARIGLASGYKYIGNTDWYKWGADQLVKDQDPSSGSWDSGTGLPVPNTSFALLFLSRGRAPIVMNKLQYNVLGAGKRTTEGPWNQRPRDVANIARYMGHLAETNLSWQIVNITERASDLLDAPLLFVAGNQPLKFGGEDAVHLKEYVEQGGIILGNADCANAGFADSFKAIGEGMFPGYKFHPLPMDHPIVTSEGFNGKVWNPQPKIEILDNGARVLMVLIPSGDPARDWQTGGLKPVKQYPIGQFMADLYLYATDSQSLKLRGESFTVRRKENVTADSTTKVARLQYKGNWDPEPFGWTRLGNLLHNREKLDITVEAVELGAGKLTNEYKLADLTGTDMLTLTDPQRQELKKFVEGGGTLLVDSCGGKSAFTVSAQDELIKIWPGTSRPLPVLPASNPIFSLGLGDPIREVSYRKFSRSTLGAVKVPQLRGIEVAGRTGVVFSGEDLAVGLVGQQVDGLIGYEPNSAARLATGIVLMAQKGGK